MKKILPLFCALLLSGCAGRMGRSVANYDVVEAVQVQELIRNNLARTPFAQQVVYLNARCETKKDGSKKYYLFTELIASPDFTLHSGESLILNLDGQVLAFPSATVTNTPSFQGRKRFATTFYPVPEEVLGKLAQAGKAHVRLKGVGAVIDKELSPRNLRRFDEFAARCALSDKKSPPAPTNAPSQTTGG